MRNGAMRDYVNLAHADRGVRILVGGAMLAFGWSHLVPGLWGVACQLFGWFPLVTGLAGWCPVYVLVGWRSRRPAPHAGGPDAPPDDLA